MKLRYRFVGLLVCGCFLLVALFVFITNVKNTKTSINGLAIFKTQNDSDNIDIRPTTNQHNSSRYDGRNTTLNKGIQKRPVITNHIVIRNNSTNVTQIKDYYRLPFIIENTEKCKGNVSFVVLVNSGADYHARRTALRNTWADQKLFDKHEMRVVFLLGKSENATVQSNVFGEHFAFGDIVQGNFIDTYYNVTYKGMLGFRWVLEHCSNAKHVVKVDDDVHIDVFQLMKMLTTDIEMKTPDKSIWCEKRERCSISRSGRWKLDEDQFYGMKTYPVPLCTGLLVIIPTCRIQDLYLAASDVDFIRMDDVLLFSIVPYMVGLEKRPLNKYILRGGQTLITCSQKGKPDVCRTNFMAVMMAKSDGKIEVTDFWTQSLTKMIVKIWILSLKTSDSFVNAYGNKQYISAKVKRLHDSLENGISQI